MYFYVRGKPIDKLKKLHTKPKPGLFFYRDRSDPICYNVWSGRNIKMGGQNMGQRTPHGPYVCCTIIK